MIRNCLQIKLYNKYDTAKGQTPFPVGDMRPIKDIAVDIKDVIYMAQDWGAEQDSYQFQLGAYDGFLKVGFSKEIQGE